MRHGMVAVLLALGFLAPAGTFARAAEGPSALKVTVAEWRQAMQIGGGRRASVGWAHGAMFGLTVFGSCTQGLSAPELEAYMLYTADTGEILGLALLRFALQRGCAAWSDPQRLATARQEGRSELALELVALRASMDLDSLRDWVALGQANDASAEAIAYGLVAGARLLELQTGGQRAPTPRPQDIRR